MIVILRMMILNYKKHKLILCLKSRNILKKIMKELVKEKQNIIGQEWVKESTYQENHAKTTTKITKKKHPTAIPRISILLNLSEKIKDMIEFRSSWLKITT